MVLQAGRKSDLEGRQGASTKRANSDFPSRGWKIVIGQFNHPGRTRAICGNLGQSAYADCLTTYGPYGLPAGRRRTVGAPLVSFHPFYDLQVELIYIN